MSAPRRRPITFDDEARQVVAAVVADRIEQGLSLDSPMIYAQVALLVESVLGRPIEVSAEALADLERISHL